MENFKTVNPKTITVAHQKWSFTTTGWKGIWISVDLVYWISGRLWEVVAHEGSAGNSVLCKLDLLRCTIELLTFDTGTGSSKDGWV